MATIERVLSDVRRIEEIDDALNSIHDELTIQKTQEARTKLKPLSDEFDSYSYIGSFAHDQIAYQTYKCVRDKFENAEEQLKRLSEIKVHATAIVGMPTVIVGMPTDGPQEPASPSQRSLTLIYPGKGDDRGSLVSVDSESEQEGLPADVPVQISTADKVNFCCTIF